MTTKLSCNQRVAVLIDSSNVFVTSIELGVKVHYSKLMEYFDKRQVVRSIVYHVELNPAREAGFIHRIKKMGFEETETKYDYHKNENKRTEYYRKYRKNRRDNIGKNHRDN